MSQEGLRIEKEFSSAVSGWLTLDWFCKAATLATGIRSQSIGAGRYRKVNVDSECPGSLPYGDVPAVL